MLQKGWLYQTQLAIAAEVDAAGNVVKQFGYGTHANVPDFMLAADTGYRILTDHLGSVRLVIDWFGNVRQRIDYDAYGRVLTNTNPGFQPFGYAGGLLDDATGLTRFGARDYDAEVGRWTTKDPIRFAGASANLYSYAADDPVDSRDPSGLWPLKIHYQLIDATFGGSLRADELAMLYRATDEQDRGEGQQSVDRSYQHSMRSPDETASQARQRRDDFIRHAVSRSRALNFAGERCLALLELGRALHTVMDQFAPLHVNANGDPMPWEGLANPSAVSHWFNETRAGPPGAARTAQIAMRMRTLYTEAFGKKP